MRDLRDPQALGERYLQLREAGIPIDVAADMPVANYEDGPWMSAVPTEHHLVEHEDVHLLASGEDLSA